MFEVQNFTSIFLKFKSYLAVKRFLFFSMPILTKQFWNIQIQDKTYANQNEFFEYVKKR
jgi:hypothetical protein